MWDDYGFFPESGLDILVSLSLITIEDDTVFRMHDQLRDLGRNIVYQENPSASEERSRLWSHKEAVHILNNQLGTKKVQTLHINYGWQCRDSYCFSNHDFKGMSKLRYLHLAGSNLEGDFNRLLPELRWLTWKYSPRALTRVAVTNFCPRKLVILDLSNSNSGILDDWKFLWKQMETLSNLKVLDLSYCRGLTKTPDFSEFWNLERLKLRSCEDLTEIGSSVKHLKRLTYFNAQDCPHLRKLPLEFGSMAALQEVFLDCYMEGGISELPESIGLLTQLRCLSLRDCNSLKRIPEIFWNLKSLVELEISKTGITEILSEGFGMLEKLEVLNCFGCTALGGAFSSGIGRLSSLRRLDLSSTRVDTLPEDIGSLCNLIKFNLSHTAVKKLPGVGIERLQKLEVLNCSGCYLLRGELPDAIWSLSSLRSLDLTRTRVDTLLEDIGSLCNLREFNLSHTAVKKLPGVGIERLQKLEVLNCSGCYLLRGELPDAIWSLSSLRSLDLTRTRVDTLPEDIGSLCNLRELNLGHTDVKKLPGVGIERLQKLEVLNCSDCSSLEGQLPSGIGSLSSLRVLNLSATGVDTLPEDVGSLCNLRELKLSRNRRVKKLPRMIIERLQYLEELDCSECDSLEGELSEGIWSLSSLRYLNLESTQIVGRLPKDISGLSNLVNLGFRHCEIPAEELKLPLSLMRLVIPLTEASFNGVRSLVNLRYLEFYWDGGYCCQSVEEEEEVGVVDHRNNNPFLPIIDMPSNLEDLTLMKFDDHMMSCRLLPAMKFDSSSRLKYLYISSCTFGTLPTGSLDLSNCQTLKELYICNCPVMREMANFGKLGSTWERISIELCESLEVVTDLSSMKRLKTLEIHRCPNFRDIKGLENLTTLKELRILKKDQLHPDLLNSKCLNIILD